MRTVPIAGVSTIGIVVDQEGHPKNVKIVHPLGLGLDEPGVAAVSRYLFKPAMKNGLPVPVRVNIEINIDLRRSNME